MQLTDIRMRDPFILVKDDRYYMYGTYIGENKNSTFLEVYTSEDMVNWSQPKTILSAEGELEDVEEFWAPEVYERDGRFYMFVTIKRKDTRRGTCVCVSDSPDKAFVLHSEGIITPNDWECLDGTIYIEDGKPYMIFCHEWRQINDGKIYAIELDEDLKRPKGDAVLLARASQAEWVDCLNGIETDYVTDGPFLFKEDGKLYMSWSSFVEGDKYAIGLLCSECGKLFGEWKHIKEPIYTNDGGHAMIFEDMNKERKIVFHEPNNYDNPTPQIKSFLRNGQYKYCCV